jgi:uncharacterized protein (TIGR03790 family)
LQRLIPLSAGLLLGTVLAGSSLAQLRPDEVAIVCSRDSRESRTVAAYYAKVRAVPTENVLALTFPSGETLSRDDWQTQVRPAIQRWLSEGERRAKIRCFVTVWDVPLKIGMAQDSAELQRLIAYLTEERKQRVGQINEYVQALIQLAGPGTTTEFTPLGADAGLEQIKSALDQSFGAAQNEVVKIEDEAHRTAALQRLQQIYFRSVGLNMMAQSLGRQLQSGGEGVSPQARSEFDVVRGRTAGLREGRAAVEGIPFGLEREPQLLALLQLSDGVYGTLAWLDEQIAVLSKNETHASFDSELSLVAWPEYTLVRWQPNYLNFRFDGSPIRQFKPVYMVARIEAPTLKRTREIIDQALEVEKTGLKGKVYLDARGVTQPGYVEYDQSLQATAELIKQHTSLEVVLDAKQELFQAGAAPDAALYCGWYSLGKYVDAFDWVPGAVGYHLASNEATTLRDPASQVWCKRMLEDGVVATIGPVEEPYIAAFPRPNEFFLLLLSGKFTLVETYYRCLPFNSWTMVLVGDPLYAPFKAAPPLRMEGLDELSRRIINGPISLLEEPLSSPAPAPAADSPATTTQ